MKKITITLLATLLSVCAFASGHITTATSTPAFCFGSCNGTAVGSVTGGIGPFEFAWTDGNFFTAVGDSISNLCAGTYTLTVTDSSDMSVAIAVATITEPIAITTNQSFTICVGDFIVVGVLPNQNIYATTGTYYDTLTTANGCDSSVTTYLAVNPLDNASFSYSSNVFCNTGANPLPIITGTLGGVFTIAPSNAYVNPITGELGLWAPAGTYTVSYTTYGICPDTSSFPLVVIPQVFGTFSYTGSPYCQGALNALPTFSLGASAGLFTVSSLGLVLNTSAGQVNLAASTPGIYTVTNIVQGFGCPNDTATSIIEIIAQIPFVPDFTMVPDSANALTYWVFDPTVGMGYTYNWDYGDGSSRIPPLIHTYASAGTYNVCRNITNTFGCTHTKCDSVTVSVSPSPCLSLFNATRNAFNSNAYTITNLSYGSNLSYLWDFGDTSTSTLQLPSHSYSSIGPYQLCLSVDNGAGCSQTFCDLLVAVDSLGHSMIQPISLVVLDGPPSQVQTSLSENDNLNKAIKVFPNPSTDKFQVYSLKLKVQSIEIYNVIGEIVYQSEIKNPKSEIDISSQTKGIYFYKVYSTTGEVVNGKLVKE